MDKKWTHIMFAVAGIVLAWLLSKCGEWAWSYFSKPNSFIIGFIAVVIGTVVTIVCWKNEEIFNLANEVATELQKVTWPTRQETLNSTLVVIVTTIISSAFLGLFDGMWSWVTRQIYG